MAEACLVDSGVWIGGFNPRDRHHAEAAPILRAIGSGRVQAVITDPIYGEVVTYLRRKVGVRPSVDAARALLDSPCVTIVIQRNPHAFSPLRALHPWSPPSATTSSGGGAAPGPTRPTS